MSEFCELEGLQGHVCAYTDTRKPFVNYIKTLAVRPCQQRRIGCLTNAQTIQAYLAGPQTHQISSISCSWLCCHQKKSVQSWLGFHARRSRCKPELRHALRTFSTAENRLCVRMRPARFDSLAVRIASSLGQGCPKSRVTWQAGRKANRQRRHDTPCQFLDMGSIGQSDGQRTIADKASYLRVADHRTR